MMVLQPKGRTDEYRVYACTYSESRITTSCEEYAMFVLATNIRKRSKDEPVVVGELDCLSGNSMLRLSRGLRGFDRLLGIQQ